MTTRTPKTGSRSRRTPPIKDAASAQLAASPVGVMNDALINALTGMGGEKDKVAGTSFSNIIVDRPQLDAAYRGDWISRKGVDIPAYDATREWRSWEADTNDLTALTNLEKTLNVQRKTMLALQRGRLYGGGALIMGVDQGTSDQELIVENVKKNDLKFLHVVSRFELSQGPIEWDIMSPYFGTPQYYDRSNPSGVSIRLHPSRVVRFIGQEVPDLSIANGWGDSVLQVVSDAILSTGMVSGSIAQLISEAKVDIVKIPGLSENIATKKYEDNLKKRFSAANLIKSVYSLLIIDKEEEWSRIESRFQGMPQIIQMYLLIVCGALDIPATRFLGQSPAGMSATGDSDTRNYYDRVSTEQNITISPAMERLDEVIIRSALGARPPELWYDWNALWQMDDAQKAAIAVQKATAFTADVTAGLITPLVLQKARENQLVEDGTYPGLEALIEQYGEDYVEPPPPVIVAANSNDPNAPVGKPGDPSAAADVPQKGAPTGAAATRGRATATGTGDAAMAKRIRDGSTPRTLYVRRDVVNQDEIKAWAKAQGFATSLNDMHVTIFYSKSPVDWLAAGDSAWGEDKEGQLKVKAGGPRVMEHFGKAVVLAFANSDLSYRHCSMMDSMEGASWSYDDYTPHVTITYDAGSVDVSKVKPYTGPITLGPEIFEEINSGFNNETDNVES